MLSDDVQEALIRQIIDQRELVASSFSGITLALGYLFGSRGRP